VQSDPDSTQILTQHCGAKSQTVSQIANSGTTRLGKYPAVQPLRVIETTEDGVGVYAAPPSDNPDGSGGFISHQHKLKQYIWNLCRLTTLGPLKISMIALYSSRLGHETLLILNSGRVVMSMWFSKSLSLLVGIGASFLVVLISSASRYIFSFLESLKGVKSSSSL
jgi:hypothetical protein